MNKKIETLEITRDDRVESAESRLQAELEKNEELERMHEEAKKEVKSLRTSMGAMESNAHADRGERTRATEGVQRRQS